MLSCQTSPRDKFSNRVQVGHFLTFPFLFSFIAPTLHLNSLDDTYIKAYYRRGSANFALSMGTKAEKLKEARKDFKQVLKIKPTDAHARKQYNECDKQIKALAFLAAIEVEDTPSATIDINSIVISSDYVGPRLPEDDEGKLSGEPLTEVFVHDMIGMFREQKLIHKKYLMQILKQAAELFKEEPTLLDISLPKGADGKVGHITVCGDTHGQYYDLLNIFEIGGFPSVDNPYLFNGDFVDRGSFSLETVTTLIAIKLMEPSAIYMHRGNHETKNMNKVYGFEGEVKHKYDETCMKMFTEVFQWLPLASVIEKGVFCVHGGLSTTFDKDGFTLDKIREIRRGREPPESGLMSDLLWADPQPLLGRSASKRGVGFAFGPDYTDGFLKANDLQLLVRSHEVKEEGYIEEHGGKCITIFSAPNYCDQQGNKGAFIRFGEDLKPNFTKFQCVPHPNVPCMTYAGNMFGL